MKKVKNLKSMCALVTAVICAVFLMVSAVLVTFSYTGASPTVTLSASAGMDTVHFEILQDEDQIHAVHLTPCKTIAFPTEIHNLGADMKVRAKITYISPEGLADADLTWKMADQWELAEDGYYYYTGYLTDAETVPLIESVTMGNWDNSYMGQTFDSTITVEAVQNSNTSENVWDGLVVQQTIRTRMEVAG